jgi:DNA-binding MarR family transcriptional regulator
MTEASENVETSGSGVIASYHRFRRADDETQSRVRAATGMGDNELRVVQYIVAARRRGHEVKPTEISRHLGISSASTTALLDRLERGGSVERINNPDDRRSVLLAPTSQAEAKLAESLEAYERKLHEISDSLVPTDRVAVSAFFDALTAAAATIASDAQSA